MIQGAGAVTSVFVAGCIGGDDDDETTPVTGNGDGDGNGNGNGGSDLEFHTFLPGAMNPQEQIQNPWGSNHHALAWAVHPQIARWATAAEFNTEEEHTYDQFVSPHTESLDIDEENGVVSFDLYDDWQWTSGDEVTAEDVLLHLRISQHVEGIGSVLWNNISDMYADGEKTVVIELGDVNVDYATKQLFTEALHISPPREVDGEETVFVEYLERLDDASTEEEINEIDTELNDDHEWPIDETVSCGAWEVVDATETVAVLEPNEGFHSPVEFSARMENFDATGGRAQPISAALSQQIQAGPLPQPEHIEQIQQEDDMEVVIRTGTEVQGLAFNWNTDADDVPDVYADPRFRQGIAHVLNNENIDRAHPTRTSGLDRADGVFFNVEEQLPNIHDDLRTYETDHERAEELLTEAGLSLEDGTWYYDGEPLLIEHISPDFHHWPTTGQATVGQLGEFGFETEFRVDESFSGILWGRDDDTWNSLRTHTDALSPISYMDEMFGDNSMVHFPETVEVPKPVGDWDGSMEEVNVREAVDGLAQLTGDEYTEQMEELAWVYNYTLPSIPTNVENWGMMYWGNEWEWPAKDDPLWGINYTNRSFMSIPAMSPR
ncbi:ABC transporter substrate-binding protein [Halobacteria archaeon AArc-m2/3/4]|uniref:ABC transporter substrate-binding protein n=1 Tax=Natronoglomus mannanivorans TaxID=2979990 RepID=A0AAP3E4A4_9EURY|nr:ABC transporter substrate-binding protein [Halobacteria archaeon AArc-xg1-1]MCU4972304.1 ABC transporter substrate-binding protein [Halobacteria archaeon AArc-m2/3/4]